MPSSRTCVASRCLNRTPGCSANWPLPKFVWFKFVSFRPEQPTPKMLKIRGTATAGMILCMLQTAMAPPARAFDREIELINDTRIAIIELYAAQAGSGRWKQDLLGEDFLRPGDSLVVKIEDGTNYCRYDLKVVLDDGTSRIDRDLNVCSADAYAISFSITWRVTILRRHGP